MSGVRISGWKTAKYVDYRESHRKKQKEPELKDLDDEETINTARKGKQKMDDAPMQTSAKHKRLKFGMGESAGNKTVIKKEKDKSFKRKREKATSSTNEAAEAANCGTSLNHPVLFTRSCPKKMYSMMSNLHPHHKGCLDKMGFSSKFKVDGVPTKLGLYVVDNFDPVKMEIKVEHGILAKKYVAKMM